MKQHFVPRVYLRHFCNVDGVLQKYDKETGVYHSCVDPAAESFLNDLYTVKDAEGREDYRVEQFFCGYETKYAKIMQKILADGVSRLSNQNIKDLLMFLALLNARNPERVESLKYVGSILGKHPFNADFEKLTDPDYLQSSIMESMRLWAEKINGMMRSTGWVIYVSAPDNKFITTDNPMADLSHVPLSSHLLFAFQSLRANGLQRGSPEFVAEMNHRIASTATQFIYAADVETLESPCSFL